MKKSLEALRGKVVVVTGASSGLGRATAVQFASHGCIVVTAARRAAALAETVRLCQEAGGRALHCVTDVTREEDVRHLAEFAAVQTGCVDVWINNAGTTLFGSLEQASFEEHRRVIETNLFGAMLSARAVWPIFRKQRHGILINIGSVLSKIGQPFVPSYVISKFGLAGLSETLRTSAANEPNIHVCSLYPYAMNTPHFESGANHLGQAPHTMPPAQSPEKVARVIVELAARPRRDRYVPRIALLGLGLHAVMPRTVERLLLDALTRWHLGAQGEPSTSGNLYQPTSALGEVCGNRPPRISGLAFTAWAFWHLGQMQLSSNARLLRHGWARARWAILGKKSEGSRDSA